MNPRTWRFVFLAVFTSAVAALLFARQAELGRLRRDAEHSHRTSATLADLRQANARLEAGRVSEQELASLRAGHATVVSMRNEIAAIERSVEARERAASPSTGQASADSPTLLDGPLTSDQWHNAGRSTPVATVETMLWAAARGESGRLAETLALGREARAKAEAIYTSLPPDLRQELSTPENLLGALTAKEITMRSAQVVAEVPQPQGTTLILETKGDEGQLRRISLSLRADGNAWRIEVPPAAVDRFAAQARDKSESLQLPPVRVN